MGSRGKAPCLVVVDVEARQSVLAAKLSYCRKSDVAKASSYQTRFSFGLIKTLARKQSRGCGAIRFDRDTLKAPADGHGRSFAKVPSWTASTLEAEQVASAYGRWAPVYDILFGPVFRRGRLAAVAAAERVGGRILEVGVGTGLSLPSYASSNQLTGIDICEPMLERARLRVRRLGLRHVRSIAVGDAENLDFPTASFDVVVAQYVVTAVAQPERALDEFVRVVRPGGEIILTSRIGAETGLRGTIERWLMPLTSRLGWRTEFAWSRYQRWAASCPAVTLLERRALPPLGHFSLIRFLRVAD